jgi:hypothetical protein
LKTFTATPGDLSGSTQPLRADRRQQPAYSVEKLISCRLTILLVNHSVAENQA